LHWHPYPERQTPPRTGTARKLSCQGKQAVLQWSHRSCSRFSAPAISEWRKAPLRPADRGENIRVKTYTSTGDDGYTDLLGADRVPKYAPRPTAYGTLDELSSALGLARATVRTERSGKILLDIQRHLYQVMTELAATPEAAVRFPRTTGDDVAQLERLIDELEADIELPNEFIVPGDTLAGAALDLARAITRRAERIVARLIHHHEFDNGEVLRYLNRLSSLLFILARYEDAIAGVTRVTPAKQSEN
jgi:cob(I)alamin adenosyltransferase